MRILPEETGAVVIDMQEKLMSAMHETKACEEKAAMLLKGLQVLSAAAGIKPFWINSKLWARRICLLWEQKPIFACCSHVWI